MLARMASSKRKASVKAPAFDPDAAATGAPGSDGTFYWGGYATTMVDMDPKEDLVTLAFTQVQPGDMEFRSRIHNLVYQAIAD